MSDETRNEMEIRVAKLDSEVMKFFANPENHYKIVKVVWNDGYFFVSIQRELNKD